MSQIDDFLDGNSSAQQTKSQIDSFLDAAPVAQGGAISDLGKSLKVGAQKLPGMVTGLADLPIALATGARPFTKAADALGEATGFQPGKWAGETKFSQGYEDSKKAVDAAWKDGSAADIAGAYLSNPAYTANQVAESLPSMVAGGVASKALLGAGRVAGVAADAAAGTAARAATPGLVARTVGEKWAAPVAAGVGEGAVTAGQQMDGYQGEDQQKNALAALGAGVGTAVIGVGAGRLANKMGLETAETAMAKVGTGAGADVPLSLKQRVLGGMVSEAVLQELPQSVQEQMWSNFADGKPLMEGVARAGTEGALAGGVMGAGANLRGGSSHAKARQNAEAAAADAQAKADATVPQWDTEPGAAGPSTMGATGTASAAHAPGVAEANFTTSPGASAPREGGMDFTREVDTSSLSLEDPAEVERARAATLDYEPVDATPQWDTERGAAPGGSQGLEMEPRQFDTGSLAIGDPPAKRQLGYSPLAGTPAVFPDGSVALGSEAEFTHRYAPQPVQRPSEAMGLDPAAGPLSRIAVQAVDSGAYMPPAGPAPALAPEPDPVVLQNRDRTSAASIAQMQEIAANPDYLRVGPSRDMTSGAPVVFGELPPTALLGRPETVVDGHGQRMGTQYAVVDALDLIASNNADGTTVAEYATGAPGKLRSVAGNGRTAGLQAAYQMGTAQRYRQELAGDAAALGVDAQALATMQRPVLVRVMQGADVTRDMGDRTNITATQKLSPLEQAGNDARRLDVGTLAFDEGGNPTPDAIKGFVSAMPVAERGDMLNPDGTPTRQAVDRLMAATFKQAYESDELVQLYAQATDPDARAVMAAAADASGVLANLKGAGEFDVRGAVADAAKMAVNAARQGLKLSDVLQNQDLDMSPEAYPVAAYLAQHIRTPKKMAEGLRRWGQLALEQARIADENTHQGSLLGPRPTLSRPEIFARLGSEANPTGQGIAPAAPAPQPAPEQAALVPPAQAAPAAAERHPTWRKNAIQAGRVARALGLEPKGKRLAQIVAEIDAVDAQQTGAAQDGADLSSGPIDQEWSAFAPETGTLGIARAQMPQIKAEHRGALVNFLKARGIDSAAGEVPANDLKPTQAEFAPGKVKKAREFQGSEGSILVSSDGHVVDGHHQWLAKRAAGEPVKVIRLKAPIRDVLAQVAEFPSARMAEGAARATPAQAATDSGADAQGAGAMFSRAVPGSQDFVPAPDGGLDYGEITPEMGKAMRRQAGVIRLQQGVQNADGTGWGLAHIEANHGNQIRNAGFASVQDFVAHIANGFNEVLQASKGGQLLVAVSTGRRDVMFVQLEAAQEGDFYRVNTAFPVSRNYLEKQESKGAKILWSGSEPRSAATGRQPLYAGSPDAVSGQDAPIAQGENSLNEPLWERAGTSAPTADKSSSPSPWGQSGSASVALKDDSANYARADAPMSPDLARAILALGSPPKQATKESVRAAVRELVNGLGLLPNRLGRIVVATSAEIKQDWEPLIGPTGMEASGDAGRAQGFYDPKSKTVFLIADNIRQGDELGVVAHELMHKHGPAVLGEEGWNRLHGALGGWAKAKVGSMERIVYDEAVRRVRASGPELSTQELFPYAVQVALEMGVRPNAVAPQGTVERWLGQVRAALRQVWDKITRKPELFKSQDLVNLAFGIAQRENLATGTSLDALGASVLDVEGPSFSRSAMKSVEANVARGRQALAKALTERTSVNRAMFRNGLGWVDFVWGDEGRIKPSGKTKGAMGLSHILEARQRKDGMSEQEAIDALSQMVNTIASGRELERSAYANTVALKLERDGYRVGLVKRPGSNAWVVTAFELNQMQGRPDIDARPSTQSKSTLPRDGLGAGSMASGGTVPSLDRPTRQDSTERGGPAGAGGVGSLAAIPSADNIQFSRAAPTAIESSMGAMTPEQEAAYKRVAGVQKVPTLKERMAAMKANLGLKLRQGLVDQFAAIKQLDQNAYMQARMSQGTDGTLEAMLLYGKPFMRDGAPDVDIKDGGFAKVLASLKGEQDRWMMWIAAQRAERLKAEGKENLMTDDDISALKTLNAGKMADGAARVLVYAKALQELNAYNDAMLKLAMDSGLIDQGAYDLMKDQPYVPFYRMMEEGDMKGPKFSSGLINQKAWQKLKGGTQQLNADLLQNMLLNWSHLLQASAKNRAALATMDAAEKLAIAYPVPADTKGAVKVMRGGMAQHWLVEDPYLLEAISALHYVPSPLMKPLSGLKQLLTWGVTVNPTFKIRNLVRDSVSAIAQSELGYSPAGNVARGWKLTASDSQVYASMLASGGTIKFGTQENTDRLRAQVAKLGGVVLDKSGTQKFMGQLKELYDVYNEFGDRAENVNRAALYDALIKKGKTHAEASFMARDLMDFSMSGGAPVVRFLTQTVPFLNARLVGLDKLGRAAMENPRRFGAVTGAVALASLALMALYGDDEDWKRREDWDRDAYWWFKVGGTALRIPKPFEVGAIGTLAERTAELMLDDEMTGKRYMERVSHMLSGTFSFNPVPQAFKPLLDLYANKDSFTGRAIESQADQRLRPQDRYSERTSEVAKFLGALGLPDPAQLVKGEYAALSPKQVEHLIRGYFSWVGTSALTVSDYALRPLADRGERPGMRLKDVFLAGNFVENLPTGSSRYVTQMYEQARSAEQAYASYREAIKTGDMDKAAQIQERDGAKLRNRMAYANAARQLSEINAQAKRIEASRLLPGDVKRERLTELEQRRHAVAQRVGKLTLVD
ncbi:LPD38 domain-containing protein [Simplicispira metamorpha]|uniref:Large polyvalent protein-associated domain-containing protein n=1 Tax=Simplicispira metamorpha TaxID=80881 RepID=A0A4R2N7R4_9BURK|nr:LPD38 domain-containing protein [Simplicispira metamorpha]TCP16915.1 hypothetical protein EV674_11554 [Simplicispira metamorpha]